MENFKIKTTTYMISPSTSARSFMLQMTTETDVKKAEMKTVERLWLKLKAKH